MNALIIEWVGTLLLLGVLARLSYVDWKTYRLPNVLTKPLIIFGLIFNFFLSLDFYTYLLGAILGYAIFWTVETVYRLIRKRDGLGRGDAKLLAAGGAWCGALALPFIIFIASSAGIIYILSRPASERNTIKLAFGPFLAAGIAITFLVYKFI